MPTRTLLRPSIVFALLILSTGARGGDEVVADCSNDTELREKLTTIQTSTGGTLSFGEACGPGPVTIVLTAFTPSIRVPTTIDGGGKVTLSGGNERTIFDVQLGGELTLRRIVLTNGRREVFNGGAVVNVGTLILDDVQILRSSAQTYSGGAIWSAQGSRLEIRNSTLAFNDASNGGAIFADDGAQVTITNSVFHHNTATRSSDGWGGALLLWEGADVTIEGGEFHDNTAYVGGAITTLFASAFLSLDGTVLRNNRAREQSGALHVGRDKSVGGAAAAELNNVTLSTNSSDGSGGGISCLGTTGLVSEIRLVDVTLADDNNASQLGGGIFAATCTVRMENTTVSDCGADVAGGLYLLETDAVLANVTVSGNSARVGGGMYLNYSTVTVTNATIAGNSAAQGAGVVLSDLARSATFRNVALADNAGGNCAIRATGAWTAEFSLSSDDTCRCGPGRDGVDLLLDPLADNGGPTKSHLPRTGSPAIDGGTTSGCPATDQRGAPRPVGASCDVGAVEVGATPPSTTTSTSVASSIPTTTTLPAGACTPACMTVDPCRAQACVDGACVTEEPVGLARATCACQRSLPAACTGATVPAKIAKATGKACALLGVASSSSGRRLVRKLVKASRKWTAASKLLFKKPGRVLSPDCAAALETDYDDAGARVDRVIQALEAAD